MERNVDPVTGVRQDVVVDQDLKNGLSSVLEFCAEGFRKIAEHSDPLAAARAAEEARAYLLQVSRDIASGRGHPAPNPGPVTPPAVSSALGNRQPKGVAMDEDRVKTVISTVITAAAVLVPGVSEALDAVGGPSEVAGVVLGAWGVVHGLVHYVHAKSRG